MSVFVCLLIPKYFYRNTTECYVFKNIFLFNTYVKHLKCAVFKLLIRESEVGISTPCELDGSGFKPGCGQEILPSPYQSRPPLEPTQPPLKWC